MRSIPRLVVALIAVVAAFSATAPLVDAAKKSTFVYVHDSSDDGQVFGYSLGAGGGLTELPGSPFTSTDLDVDCRGSCQSMAYSDRRKVLLTSNANGVSTWLVGAGGALTRVQGSPFHAPEAIGITVMNVGKLTYVYVARNAGALTAFRLEKDGKLTFVPGFPFSVGSDLIGATSVKKRLLIVDEAARKIHTYRVRRGGSVTAAPGSPYDFSANGSAHTARTDAKGKYAIVGGGSALEVRRLKGNGHLDEIKGGAGRLELAGSAENGPAVSRKGLIAVIPIRHETGTDDLSMFAVRKKALVQLGGLQSTGMPAIDAYTFDPTGKLLVAASREGDEVRTFAVSKDGTISAVDTAAAAGIREVTDIEVIRR